MVWGVIPGRYLALGDNGSALQYARRVAAMGNKECSACLRENGPE